MILLQLETLPGVDTHSGLDVSCCFLQLNLFINELNKGIVIICQN